MWPQKVEINMALNSLFSPNFIALQIRGKKSSIFVQYKRFYQLLEVQSKNVATGEGHWHTHRNSTRRL